MTAIYVLTCARRTDDPWAYLRRTLEQLDAEPLDVEHVIFYDGEAPPANVGARWSRVAYVRPPGALPGNKLPYWSLLDYTLGRGCSDVLVLEDDLTLCRNALRRMVTFQVPGDLAWVQFFAPHLFPVLETQPGLWRPPLGSHQFLQAAKFPRRTVEQLVAWSRDDPQYTRFTASDQALALASRRLGLDYGAHAPELVQHAGARSSTSDLDELDDFRLSKTWPGEAFDALALYTRDELYR